MSDERAAEQVGCVRGFLRRVARLPLPVLALVCVLPNVLGGFGCPESAAWIFLLWPYLGVSLPGVIRRGRWKGLWSVPCVAVAMFAAAWGLSKLAGPSMGRYEDELLTLAALAILAASEMFARRQWNWRTILWVGLAVVAIPLAVFGLFEWPRLCGWNTWGLFLMVMLAIAFWATVPAAFHAASRSSGRRYKATLASVLLLPAVVSVLFSQWWCWPIVQRSAVGEGPFDQRASVRMLAWRHTPDDLTALRYAVENIPPGEKEETDSYFVMYCWRKRAIDALAQDDPAGTADLLLRMLKRNPSRSLMYQSAEILAAQKQYDVVPLFLGQALFYGSQGYGKGPTDALVSMGIPQVATAIVFSEIEAALPGNSAMVFTNPKARQQLITILGSDAGENLMDWAHLCDERIAQLPKPLTEELQAEVGVIRDAFLKYQTLRGQWDAACVAHVAGDGDLTPEAIGEALELKNSVEGPYWHGQSGKQLQDDVEKYRLRIEAAKSSWGNHAD